MPESKHTPGPWSREWISGALRHINRNVDREMFGCEDLPDDANWPSYYTDGDVDLVTAAPELLAACKEALCCFADSGPVADELAAAIAKAEGADNGK